jgi:hypothetical protein
MMARVLISQKTLSVICNRIYGLAVIRVRGQPLAARRDGGRGIELNFFENEV